MLAKDLEGFQDGHMILARFKGAYGQKIWIFRIRAYRRQDHFAEMTEQMDMQHIPYRQICQNNSQSDPG